jgi:HAD superfamily hydrolase (TIGR01509 family)
MKAYIFDLDGTLLDSMNVWEQIDVDFLEKRDIAIPDDYIKTVLSMSFQEAAAYTIKRFALPDSVNDLMREWNDMAVYSYGHTVQMKPQAKEYITSLREHGEKLAVATSLPMELYTPALKHHGIYDLFHVICSTDEIGYGKASPDIYLLTASRIGVSACDCVVFEDILVAIKSATSVGMTVYGVYDKSSESDWQQIIKIADGVIYDFKDAPFPK